MSGSVTRRPLRHPVRAHFFLGLGISWAGWIPYGAAEAGLLHFRVPTEVPMLSQFGPAIAAILLTALESGRSGVQRLLRSSAWNN